LIASPAPASREEAPAEKSERPAPPKEQPRDQIVTTQHTMTADGQIAYTARRNGGAQG
jgi:hypothetical protein